MHVVDMVFYWAKFAPHRQAIIQPEAVTTYQGLADAIDSICDRIERLKLDKSEPIAVSIANPAFMLAAAFAVLRSGFNLALANPPLFPHLSTAGVRNLIFDSEGLVLSSGRNIRFELSWLPSQSQSGARKPYRHRPVGDISILMYTSGTTGLPKKFVQSAAGLEHKLSSPITCANGAHSKVLIVPGIAGGFGFNRSCEVLYMGKTVGFAPFGHSALGLISNFGIDAVLASTQQAISLAEIHAETARFDVSSLKTIRVGGAVLSAEGARRIKNHLCREIIISYASTEAGTAASANYDEIAGIPGAVGFVTPETEIEVVDETGRSLPAGSEGQIRLRTPHYVKNVGLNAAPAALESGDLWFYPGDIGRVTEDGVLCLAGRSTDVINRGGAKVSGVKIEETLQSVPGVKDVAACGVENAAGLEEIWIAVVSDSPIDAANITRRVKEHPDIGVAPDQVVQIDQIPRNDLGKVQKYRLKDLLRALKRNA
jgi:acyl-coenzyme A synthetase/AMP-(fatty) acid ligase